MLIGSVPNPSLQGWDKTYCLQFLQEFDDIHFFGDKTYPVSHYIVQKYI